MKDLKDYIQEELLYEMNVGLLKDYKIIIDMPEHAEDRQLRNNDYSWYKFISKAQIISSIAKLAKDIKEDLDLGIINFDDVIIIQDKSIKPNFNVVLKIIKHSPDTKLLIITIMQKDEFKKYSYKKIYTTYSSNTKVKNDYKLFKNQI